jgi:hypothetical protein
LKFSGDLSDFETRLYLCHGGFGYLQKETLNDLSQTGLLPIYLVGQLIYITVIGIHALKSMFIKNFKNTFSEPELAFFTGL